MEILTKLIAAMNGIVDFEKIVTALAKPFQGLFQGPIAEYFQKMGKVIVPMVGSSIHGLKPMGYLTVWIGKKRQNFYYLTYQETNVLNHTINR